MGFRTVYGYSISENGWRMCDANELDRGAVPGIPALKLPVRSGIATLILKGWVSWFHHNVERLDNARGFTDEGAWTLTNDVGNSNHLSGTAVDLNWSDHPFRVSYAGFTQAEINKTREGLKLFEGTIWWGQDWNSPKDPMHFQLNYPEGDARNAAFATKLRDGYLGIWNGQQVPPPLPPSATDTTLLLRGSTGEQVKRLQQGLKTVFPSYAGHLDVDGDFGPQTEAAVREFQKRVGLLADGIVGPLTREALAKYGIRLDTTPPKEEPTVTTDRQLLEQIARDVAEIRKQLSPEGDPAWRNRGTSVRDLSYDTNAKVTKLLERQG